MKRLPLAVVASAIVVSVTGCGQAGGGKLAALKELQSSCPEGKLVQLVEIDANATQRGEQMMAVRLEVVKNLAIQTAACDGRLRLVAFGPTAAANVVLFDGDLIPSGATDNARAWRLSPMAEDVVDEVRKQIDARLPGLSAQGSDPLGALENAAGFKQAIGSDAVLRVLFETSGIATNGGAINSTTLNSSNVEEFATSVHVPNMSGVALTWAGLGRVGAGAPSSTAFVTALRDFYLRVCERSRAMSCLAVSDIAPGGAS